MNYHGIAGGLKGLGGIREEEGLMEEGEEAELTEIIDEPPHWC